MIVFGWVAAAVGAILFHVALGRTLRANPDARIPFYRNAKVIPAASITMRAAGAGLLVCAAVAMSTAGWYWPFFIVFIGPVIALLVITMHNRRVESQSRTHAAVDNNDANDGGDGISLR